MSRFPDRGVQSMTTNNYASLLIRDTPPRTLSLCFPVRQIIRPPRPSLRCLRASRLLPPKQVVGSSSPFSSRYPKPRWLLLTEAVKPSRHLRAAALDDEGKRARVKGKRLQKQQQQHARNPARPRRLPGSCGLFVPSNYFNPSWYHLVPRATEEPSTASLSCYETRSRFHRCD
ncbi:hypothetical protein DBV15_03362 [Temnothorax longispinosus]|uniref:Uncharacterized protein n=1 Tax=Temnothorax longispinosus TaxID=300112 RepID=A0A4S2JP26_9HYME|nr:hypothetical protein DBV15_03362 [Temnothorax longispinosus]